MEKSRGSYDRKLPKRNKQNAKKTEEGYEQNAKKTYTEDLKKIKDAYEKGLKENIEFEISFFWLNKNL